MSACTTDCPFLPVVFVSFVLRYSWAEGGGERVGSVGYGVGAWRGVGGWDWHSMAWFGHGLSLSI